MTARQHLPNCSAPRRRAAAVRVAQSLVAAAALAGCATTPSGDVPAVPLPAQYAGVGSVAAQGARIGADWWKLFGDPTLDALVDATLKDNADLRQAAARVDEANAIVGIARATQLPEIDLTAGASRARSPVAAGGSGVAATSYRAGLTTSFEIDLWGRLRNASAAAQAQLLSAQYARDTVQLALAAATAQTYFLLRSLDTQIALNDSTQRSRGDSLRLTERRAEGGIASPLELAQARSALASVAAQRPELVRQRALLQHQLGVLTGQPGRVVPVDPRLEALPVPATPPAGLPSDLLARRPDIQQAEAALRAAQAQVEVVRAAMYPTLSLTAAFGGVSPELSSVLNASARSWSVAPSLLFPLLDFGRNRARTEQAQAQAEQAAIGYQKTVQTAFRETADALVSATQTAEQEQATTRLREAAAETLRVAQRRFDAGYAGFLEVLDAQRGAQDADAAFVRARQARLDASVAVLKALGGGWAASSR